MLSFKAMNRDWVMLFFFQVCYSLRLQSFSASLSVTHRCREGQAGDRKERSQSINFTLADYLTVGRNAKLGETTAQK